MTEENKNENLDLWKYVGKYREQIETVLREHLPLAPPQIETKFNEAVRYVLFSGGKRLRPVLTLLGAELFGGNAKTVLPAAAAAEFIHTSSLIFDDLPCMDDAVERRGKTSLHAHFGEGLAVLVAIGFLNASYPLVFVNHENLPERAIRAHAEIVECVGAAGMLGGQSVDLALVKSANSSDFPNEDYHAESIRNLKTSALIRMALRVGAILAGSDSKQLAHLSCFAGLLGDAYQLGDDLLDLAEDERLFGDKKTFTTSQGENSARLQLKDLIERAKLVLVDNFAPSRARGCLIQLTDYLAERKF